MQIIEMNHKTVSKLLKKSVEESWTKGRDTYLKFTDGSVVVIHILEGSWSNYVSVENIDVTRDVSFHDGQDILSYITADGKEQAYTSRTVLINFDKFRYYYHRNFDRATRSYIPVAEFHYYEKGETWE